MICVKLDCVPGLSHDLKTIVRRWLQLNKSKGVHIIPRRFGDNKNVKCTVVSKKVFIGDVLAALTAGTCMLFPNTLIMLPSLRSACVPLDLSQYIFFFSIVDPVFHAGVKGVSERRELTPCVSNTLCCQDVITNDYRYEIIAQLSLPKTQCLLDQYRWSGMASRSA